jgi:hypothetical protein
MTRASFNKSFVAKIVRLDSEQKSTSPLIKLTFAAWVLKAKKLDAGGQSLLKKLLLATKARRRHHIAH